tara:strand:- start:48 stop:218 length:171 start_codon:yes stop_codon:yes gene_type:complete
MNLDKLVDEQKETDRITKRKKRFELYREIAIISIVLASALGTILFLLWGFNILFGA